MGFYCHIEECYLEYGNTPLIQDDTDDRQEWCIIYYHCPECNTRYERMINYKTQGELIETDTLYLINKKGNKIKIE